MDLGKFDLQAQESYLSCTQSYLQLKKVIYMHPVDL